MLERNENSGAVIDLADYRQKKYTPAPIREWAPTEVEKMIDEVSLHLLRAVDALLAMPHTR